MSITPKDPRGELKLDDDGLFLYDAERDFLALGRRRDRLHFIDLATLVASLEDLGRLRARTVDDLADRDGCEPFDELRERIRLALERQTERILEERDSLSIATTHALKDLVCAYTGLGGDLELTATVAGDEYTALVGELAAARSEAHALRTAADRVLDVVAALGAGYFEGTAYDDLRETVEDLAAVRGRS
jgi:hypothetical protein